MLAVDRANINAVRILLERQSNLDLVNKNNETALALAVRKDQLEMARLLLEAGANPYLSAKVVKSASEPIQHLLDQYKSAKHWIKKIF